MRPLPHVRPKPGGVMLFTYRLRACDGKGALLSEVQMALSSSSVHSHGRETAMIGWRCETEKPGGVRVGGEEAT